MKICSGREREWDKSLAWVCRLFTISVDNVEYAQKYGKIPGGFFSIPIGVAVGALARLVTAR